MDAAVLLGYGWDDLARSAVAEFIELPTDPGKKRKYRLSWPSEVQVEVLKRCSPSTPSVPKLNGAQELSQCPTRATTNQRPI